MASQGVERNVPFQAIANSTYDWETWVGADNVAHWINPAVERITGYTPAECLAMEDYPLPLVHEEDRELVVAHLASAANGGSGNHEEFRILRKDGGERWGAVSWQPVMDAEGKISGYRTSVRDITDTKRIEAELRTAYSEAEKADHAKTRFLAAASHDLRQPLQAIAMFSAALKSNISDPENTQIVSSIQECVGAANELLDALLNVSRLDAGVLSPEPRDFLICDLLEKAEVEFGAQAKDKGLSLKTVPSTVAVRTDPALLYRIVSNFIANAIRYTDKGRVLAGCQRRGQTLRLAVWDTGQGIPEELRERIFEEFFQAGNPERDRRRGLGLGLAIVQRLARLLNVETGLASTPGAGSVFWVDIPISRRQEYLPVVGKPPVSMALLEGRRILIIDDDPVQLDATSTLLGIWKCRTVTATSIAEARASLLAENVPPEAILADFRLRGGETGSEAINVVRRAVGWEIPGMLISGDTEPARLAQAAESGLRLLAKPVDPDELLDCLLEALGSAAAE